jgi:hypothetical protein
LIARKYNLEKTIDMVNGYLDWRIEKRIDEWPLPGDQPDVPYLVHMRKFKNIPDINYSLDQLGLPENFRRFYPVYGNAGFHGVDRDGRPLHIARVGATNVRKIADLCSPETFEEFQIKVHEFTFRKVFKEASELKSAPVESVSFDFRVME